MNIQNKKMTTKEKIKSILYDYEKLRKRKMAAGEELMILRADLLNPLKEVRKDITGIHGSDISDTVSKYIENLIQLESDYINEIINLVSALKKIEELVKLLPDGSYEKTLIRQKYICCNSWEQVREKLGFERTKCYEILNDALEIMEKEVEKNQIDIWN